MKKNHRRRSTPPNRPPSGHQDAEHRNAEHRNAEHRNAEHRGAEYRDGFSTADALESLHAEIVELEVFAHLAGEVITRISPPRNRAQRREYIRLDALVTKVAADAIKIVGRGDALIAALSVHLAAKHTRPGDEAPPTT
jgi:hypothetical protein